MINKRLLLIAIIAVTGSHSVHADYSQWLNNTMVSHADYPLYDGKESGAAYKYVKLTANNPWAANSSGENTRQESVSPRRNSRSQQMHFPDNDYNPYESQSRKHEPPRVNRDMPRHAPAYPRVNPEYRPGYSPYSEYSGDPGYGYNSYTPYDYPYSPRSPYRGGYGPGSGSFTGPWSTGMPGFSFPFFW